MCLRFLPGHIFYLDLNKANVISETEIFDQSISARAISYLCMNSETNTSKSNKEDGILAQPAL